MAARARSRSSPTAALPSRAPDSARSRLARVVRDELLDALERARVDDRPLKRRDLRGVELGIPDQLVDDPARRGSEPLARVRDEDGALSLAQVVARGLAGHGFVAEDAEHVVAQLERHADRMPERGQRGLLRGVGARRAPRRSASGCWML